MKAILALGIATASGGACGMSHSTEQAPACRVAEGAKLPAEIGGAEALCGAIEKAIQENAPGARYSVELRVPSPYSMAATVTLGDGRVLPEQKMSSSDRPLNRGAVDRFAAAIASEIAKSGGGGK